MTLYRLDSPVRHYEWGSPTVIPEMLGVPADGQPVAELWMGAHSAAPSLVVDAVSATATGGAPSHADQPAKRSLADLISDDPQHFLGPQVAQRYGSTLPFLLKMLAVDQPLSLQAHPSARQAKDGFAAENAAGIALDSPQRNYKDANHKPEMICALSRFEGLCGFRPVTSTVQFWTALGAPGLLALSERLMADGGIRDVVTHLLTLPPDAVGALVEELTGAAQPLAGTDGAWASESGWLVQLGADYPGDRGVVLASLLNLFRLEPGQALFVGAGHLHAYLHGTGIELMANSDNVLRGGLTRKHVDVAELVKLLEFSESVPEVLEPTGASTDGIYPQRCPDFVLARLQLTLQEQAYRPAGRPQILFCVDGAATLSSVEGEGEGMELGRGEAVFGPATDAVTVRGAAKASTVFVASSGGTGEI